MSNVRINCEISYMTTPRNRDLNKFSIFSDSKTNEIPYEICFDFRLSRHYFCAEINIYTPMLEEKKLNLAFAEGEVSNKIFSLISIDAGINLPNGKNKGLGTLMMDMITTYAKDNEKLLNITHFKIDSPSDEGWVFYKNYLRKYHAFDMKTQLKEDIIVNVKQLNTNDKIYLGDITHNISQWTALTTEIIETSLKALVNTKTNSPK